MQNQLPVTQHVHAGCVLVDCAVELELINTRMLAGEKACLGVIAVLAVVDDIAEGDGGASFGEVVAQAHRESNFLCVAGGSWRSSQTTVPPGSFVDKHMSTVML